MHIGRYTVLKPLDSTITIHNKIPKAFKNKIALELNMNIYNSQRVNISFIIENKSKTHLTNIFDQIILHFHFLTIIIN